MDGILVDESLRPKLHRLGYTEIDTLLEGTDAILSLEIVSMPCLEHGIAT